MLEEKKKVRDRARHAVQTSESCNELGHVNLRDSVTGLQRSAHQSELLSNYADHYNNTIYVTIQEAQACPKLYLLCTYYTIIQNTLWLTILITDLLIWICERAKLANNLTRSAGNHKYALLTLLTLC